MANSVHKDRQGPDWPLGNIAVATPGTQVSIMANVDPTGVNDPSTPTPATAPGGAFGDEYTARAQQILFQGLKPGLTPPKLANNTGLVYVVRKPTAGAGGVGDVGTVVAAIAPGGSFILGSSAQDRAVFSPYRYFIDADNAGDACQVTILNIS